MVKCTAAAFFKMELIFGRGFPRIAGSLLRTTSSSLPATFGGTLLQPCELRRTSSRNFGEIYSHRIAQSRYIVQQNDIPTNWRLLSHNFYENANFSSHLHYSTTPNKDCYKTDVEKPSIFKRMKQMTKDYWYVLIPVHVVTSIGWITLFYVAAKNGVDIVGILEKMNLSEKYIEPLRGSSAGHWAVAYALYKIFTPIRYTVTVGGTTVSIRYLSKWGYVTPMAQMGASAKAILSKKCAVEHKTKFMKAECKEGQRQTEPPKT